MPSVFFHIITFHINFGPDDLLILTAVSHYPTTGYPILNRYKFIELNRAGSLSAVYALAAWLHLFRWRQSSQR